MFNRSARPPKNLCHRRRRTVRHVYRGWQLGALDVSGMGCRCLSGRLYLESEESRRDVRCRRGTQSADLAQGGTGGASQRKNLPQQRRRKELAAPWRRITRELEARVRRALLGRVKW